MTKPLATRTMKARRAGICPVCGEPIQVGQQIALAGRWQHVQHVIVRQRKIRDAMAGGQP